MRLSLQTAFGEAGAPPAQRKTTRVLEVARVLQPLATISNAPPSPGDYRRDGKSPRATNHCDGPIGSAHGSVK